MNKQAFAIGDVVQLKSGGRKMTVSEKFTVCDWFVGKTLHTGLFWSGTLKLAEEETTDESN